MSSSAVCGNAAELALEIKRAKGVPPYNNDRMRRVVEESTQVYRQMMRTIRSGKDTKDPSVSCSIVVSHAIIQRNKRVGLAYLNERIKRLKRVWWQQSTLPEDLKRNMSVQEKDFYAKYGETMEGYMEQIGIFDLTTDAKPPTNLMVQVRILEHHGEVMLRSGQTVNLTPSSIRMLTSDVEGLIADGIKVEVQNQS